MENLKVSYNYKRNRDKLFANLISIIDGILSDGILQNEEVLYLSTWLLEADAIADNDIVKLLVMRINKVLEDGVISEDERAELKTELGVIQQNLMDLPGVDLYSKESDINLLIGLCKGLIADRNLSECEIKYLNWWLTVNGTLKNNYPGKHIYECVTKVLADGVITSEESSFLYNELVEFTGCDIDSGVVDGITTKLPTENVDSSAISGSTFCLTGKFLSGKRADIAVKIEVSGGIIDKAVRQKTNFLVVGTLSSRDWIYSSYGRKIEQTLEWKENGLSDIKIITEDQLMAALPPAR